MTENGNGGSVSPVKYARGAVLECGGGFEENYRRVHYYLQINWKLIVLLQMGIRIHVDHAERIISDNFSDFG